MTTHSSAAEVRTCWRIGLDWIGKLTRQRHVDMHEANVGADARWELLA